jgi:rhamnosyltransferase
LSERAQVLVLLAARNGALCIGRQLQSVLHQMAVDVRVEVRDDDSSDGTRDLVSSLAHRDSRIVLRADHASSGSAAANFFKLLREALLDGFTHVAFCDQDDEWSQDKLARAVAALALTGADGYSASVDARWADGKRRVLSQHSGIRRADHLFEGAGQGCTFVFPVESARVLQRILHVHAVLLPAIHYHDWACYALVRASGRRWCFDPVPSMTYHQHGGNDTGARNSLAGFARRLRLIRQGWYRTQVAAVNRLLLAAYPEHAPAQEWCKLAGRPSARTARLMYVVRNGRRREIDRAIQAFAVGLGYL